MRRFFFFSFVFLATELMSAPVWQSILSDSNKRIELDSTSIVRQGESVEATGRVILTKPLIDSKTGAQYRIIEAATRYHCDKKSASTLKRIYKKNENEILREEVINVVELPVRSGTLDDKVLTEVCRFQDSRPGNKAQTTPQNPTTAKTQPPPSVTITPAEQNSTVNAEKNLEPREKPTLETDETAAPTQDIRPRFAKPKRTRAQERQKARQLQAQQDIAELQTVAGKLKVANEKLLSEERAKKESKAIKKTAVQKPLEKKTAAQASASNDFWHKKVAHNVAQKKNIPELSVSQKTPLSKAVELPKTQIPATSRVVTSLPNKSNKPSRASIAEKTHMDWAYGGRLGPSHWADLRPEYRICRNGLRQSPIDIRSSIKGDLPELVLQYQSSPFRLIDAGYTLRVLVENAGFLELGGEKWTLQSLEFRRPGEEMVQGVRSEMSLHLLHRAPSGKLLILAVPLQVGSENRAIQTLWNALPLERNETVNTTQFIDFKELLPQSLAYYTYMGSLTVPPCTEGVQWVILKAHQTASYEQMRSFSFLFPDNARPLQADNARIVKESR